LSRGFVAIVILQVTEEIGSSEWTEWMTNINNLTLVCVCMYMGKLSESFLDAIPVSAKIAPQ